MLARGSQRLTRPGEKTGCGQGEKVMSQDGGLNEQIQTTEAAGKSRARGVTTYLITGSQGKRLKANRVLSKD